MVEGGPASWAAVWLVHLGQASLQGGVLILVAWAAVRLLPRMSPSVRCWLWRLAYLKLFLALFWVPPVELPVLPGPVLFTRPAAPQSEGMRRGGDEERGGAPAIPVSESAPPVSTAPVPAPASPLPSSPPPLTPSLFPILAFLWLAGAGWCVFRVLREASVARALRKSAAPVRDGWLIETCAELCWSFGLRRAPKLLLAEGYGSPLLVGGTDPAVLLPSVVMERYQPEEIRLMLAHELAHMQRGDLLWSWLPAAAHWVFFFHPLVWLANREWRLAQEIACDELAVRVTSAPVGEYGGVLVKVARQSRLNLQPGLATVGLEESPETLKTRLKAMKHVGDAPAWRVALAGVWLGLMTVGGLVPWRLTERLDAALFSGGLRYSWQPGQSYHYTVRLDAEDEEYQETQSGSLSYTVRSAEPGAVVLTHSGSLTPQRRRKDGMPVPFMGAPHGFFLGPAGTGRELRVDPYGQVLGSSGETALPYALGELSQLPLIPLPATPRLDWEVTGERAVPEPGEPETGWPRPAPFGPFSRSTEGRTVAAREVVRYSVGRPMGALVPIDRELLLRSVETVGNAPRLQLAGNSRFLFDRAAGLVRSVQFRGTLTRTSENVIRRIPITLSCTLAEPAAGSGTAAPAAPPSPAGQVADAELQGLLADLRSGEPARQQPAANRLISAPAAARRPEIAGALHELLRGTEFSTRHAAVRALKTWGTAETTPLLIPLLGDANLALRWAAIEALGALNDARAAVPLARRLPRPEDRLVAGLALRAMGSRAEEAVLPLLGEKDPSVRSETCRILKEIGTKKAVGPLSSVTDSPDPAVAFAAVDALKAVRSRLR